MASMKTHRKSERVNAAACRAIRNLSAHTANANSVVLSSSSDADPSMASFETPPRTLDAAASKLQFNNSPGSIPVPSALNCSTVESVLLALSRHMGSPAVAIAGCGALANILELDRATAGRVSRAVAPSSRGAASNARPKPIVQAVIHCQPAQSGQQDGNAAACDDEEDDGEDTDSNAMGISTLVCSIMLRHKGSAAVQSAAACALRSLYAHHIPGS